MYQILTCLILDKLFHSDYLQSSPFPGFKVFSSAHLSIFLSELINWEYIRMTKKLHVNNQVKQLKR